MAHLGKYTRSGTGHLCKHYERAKVKNEKGNLEYVKFGNQCIDPTRTELNYNLAPDRKISQIEFIQQRLGEVKCMNRKDVNVMCDWVVTLPQDFRYEFPEKQEEFFQETYNFLAKKYGEENVISAYVHLDETTPHMHFAFIPIYHDKKKNIDKVSAFKLFNKASLQKFHPELQEHLEQKLGVKCNVLNGATENGNRSIQELKNSSLKGENAELEKKNDKLLKDNAFFENKISENMEEYQEVVFKKNKVKNELSALKNEYEEYAETHDLSDLRARYNVLQNDFDILQDEYIELQSNVEQLAAEKKKADDEINAAVQLKEKLNVSLHVLENRKETVQADLNDLENQKADLETEINDLTVKKKNLYGWYERNKPIIEQWQKGKERIKTTINAILNEFWHNATVAIKVPDTDLAVKTLKTAQEKANESIDKNVPEIAKELLKADINAKTEQTEQFIRRRRGRSR